MSALTGALGGDGAPACATNSYDHAQVIQTPPGRGSLIVRAPYMVNCESLVRTYHCVRLR